MVALHRKFLCNQDILAKLAVLSNKPQYVRYVDKYYDDSSYSLTTKDMWLRQRNDSFELKWTQQPIQDLFHDGNTISGIDFYNESTDWKTIADVLAASTPHSLDGCAFEKLDALTLPDALAKQSIVEFVSLLTKRTRHRLEVMTVSGTVEVNIDIDRVEFNSRAGADLEPYLIGEVELISATSDDADRVMQQVFQELNISMKPVRGKLLEFLFRYRPKHFEALEISGVIGSKLGENSAK